MSASGKAMRIHQFPLEAADTCKIIIIYEDAAARTSGMMVCDRLVEQFGEELDFEFNWWRFRRLADPAHAMQSKAVAGAADIVMFCTRAAELPEDISDWLESWTESGAQAEGAIALVLTESHGQREVVQKLIAKFERSAQKLGMDFLQLSAPIFTPATVINHTIEPPLPPALTVNVERSHNYHWGLND